MILGLHFFVVWNTEPTEIRVMAAGPKRQFGTGSKFSINVECPNFQHRPLIITSAGCSRRAAPTALHIFKPGALWNHPFSLFIIVNGRLLVT
jgi:hypothetical protein